MTMIRHTISDIDDEPGEGPLVLAIVELDQDIDIGIDGYGTANGWDMPVVRILVEGGRLKVLVWSSLQSEDPTHEIDMEGSAKPRTDPGFMATPEDLAALAEASAPMLEAQRALLLCQFCTKLTHSLERLTSQQQEQFAAFARRLLADETLTYAQAKKMVDEPYAEVLSDA